MQIDLLNTAESVTLTIIHGPAHPTADYAQGPVGEGGIVYSSELAVQQSPRIRAAYADFFARGNRGSSVSFIAMRVFSTPDAAHLFAAQHAASCADKTRLVIDNALKLYGAVRSCPVQVRGITATITYTFAYGKVETIEN